MRKLLLALLALIPSEVSAQPDGWPSPEQIKLVHDRRATFPVAGLVTDVDWYTPREIVPGVAHPRPLPLRPVAQQTIGAAALARAVAYADAQHSYALLVWRDGALELAHYAPGFDRTSRFETASLHKTVVGLALGAAIADGRIGSVNDPISRYLPHMAGTRRGALPLRSYLEMTTGIETPSAESGDASVYWQYYFGNDLKQEVAHWPDTCKPGTEFCYANANSQYLGWAIQAAVGQRYAGWLSERLWRPLGAGDARLWLDRPAGSPRFSCCLQATAEDWVRVGRLLLDHGKVESRQIVPAAWIDQMMAPSSANPNYGWQLWRGSPHNPSRSYGKRLKMTVPAAEPFARDDVVYMDGSGAQRVYVIPSERMVIVRIGKSIYEGWDDAQLPNLILAGVK